MTYQFEMDDGDDRLSGGLIRGGEFELDRPAPQSVHLELLKKANPNFLFSVVVVAGVFIVGAGLVSSFQSGQVEIAKAEAKLAETKAKANQKEVEAQSRLMDKLASNAGQRPVCLGIVVKTCGSETPAEQPQQVQPVQQVQQVQQPRQLQQEPQDPQTPDFWTFQLTRPDRDLAWLSNWTQFCQPNWQISPECIAYGQALRQQGQSPAIQQQATEQQTTQVSY